MAYNAEQNSQFFLHKYKIWSKNKSKLIVYTYNTEDKVADVLCTVSGMKQENVQRPLIALKDAPVMVKNAKGKVRVRQTLESVAKGSNVTSGGFWGLLIGFLFGGPGPKPFEGVRYTAPGPPDMEPVIIALDDPMRVDRQAP